MRDNRATLEGTVAYSRRFVTQVGAGHFRLSHNLWFSSIGLGTYLGAADDQTDALYGEAIIRAVQAGCNVIDSAINYRCQRSERIIGQALAAVFREGQLRREEVIVATKGGYIPFDGDVPADPRAYFYRTYVKPEIATFADVVAGSHCLSPRYLHDQVERSLSNLGLRCIDVYYLHNPETQLEEVSRAEFYRRMEAAFAALEEKVAEGKIQMYGTATWAGYRTPPQAREYLSCSDLVTLARNVGGEGHHFKVTQLPYNFAMPEALTARNQEADGERVSFLEAARRLGITVIASASLLQGQLSRRLPRVIGQCFPELSTDAQRSLQFVRSSPGITTALVGMKRKGHVEENLAAARIPPASPEQLQRLFRTHGEEGGLS